MYPECRHVRPSGKNCPAAALKGSHWCYYHARMHSRQAERQAEQEALITGRRHTARRQQRLANGRFNTLPSRSLSLVDSRPGQPSRPETQEATPSREDQLERSEIEGPAVSQAEDIAIDTLDYGALPVPAYAIAPSREDAPFNLPPIEHAASIQLALIEVAQALAANRIESKRAGLLLYALQVASTNAKHVNISSHGIRSVTYTANGLPLAPQEFGWDIEDIEEMDRQEAEAENQDED